MHAHKAGAILTWNLVTGNYIAKNGADVADNATPEPTGINIDGGASGVSLSGNTVTEAMSLSRKPSTLPSGPRRQLRCSPPPQFDGFGHPPKFLAT